jgi:F0F1-type ATP synthase membrane subunit a
METTYHFVYSLVREQSGLKGLKYFPHFLSIFLLILFFNLSGLVPFSFTASSHIIVTFGIALSYFIAWIIIGIKELGSTFLYVFCPKNMLHGCYPYL